MARTRDIDVDSLLDQSGNSLQKGHSIHSVGPSDSSDSGADMMGIGGLDSTSDRNGTGERASVDEETGEDSADIAPDRIVDADGAGLGDGLDQAEEAQLGVTDEEIAEAARTEAGLDD